MNIVAFIVGLVIGICTASSCWKKAVHKTIVKDKELERRLRQLAQVKIDLDRQREELDELYKKQIRK